MLETKDDFKKLFKDKIKTMVSKPIDEVTNKDAYNVLGSIIKEYLNEDWVKTNQQYQADGVKQVYYFSIEFLVGKLLKTNLINLKLLEICQQGLEELGFKLDELENEEPEAGLGNGGLGRLAACFLDSLASLDLPGHGCGIRYKYGLFNQRIVDGHQVELPDNWLNGGYIWEVRHPDKAVEVHFGGKVEVEEQNGELKFHHHNYEKVIAVPYDVPIVGYDNKTVNNLRLWSAEVADEIPPKYEDEEDDRYRFLQYKRSVESIVEFLYPDDSDYEGKLLRLKQQYFLCSAGLQSIIRTFEKQDLPYRELPQKVRLHVNDTHPSLLIPELMRILLDEKDLGWDEAWEITTNTISYTNHTILSEALEKWPVDMFKNLLPRIFMIVQEINERFCQKLWEEYPGDFDRIAQMAIIADEQVKMANLAIVGGYSVNGVSSLHTKILKEKQMNLFYQFYPQKFNNKTNGITHRRWLLKANPELVSLITETIGDEWKKYPEEIFNIIKYKQDTDFQEKIAQVKQNKKEELAHLIKQKTGISVNTNSIFDIHAKRLHEYKRQLMNILHVLHLYISLKDNRNFEIYPHTFIFSAKAASSYYLAKRIIKLVNTVADVINRDDEVNDILKVIFLENYSVSLAETIIPAADISEQISTASKEASGTGNMKFMMNGALTLGTMDGANIDIYKMVGDDNIFIFGLSPEEVIDYYQHGGYSARDYYHNNQRIKRILDHLIEPGLLFKQGDGFERIFASLFNTNDQYFVLKDFDDYLETHEIVDMSYRNQKEWRQKCIVNIAHSGKFSGDKTISRYAADIWRIKKKIIE